MPKKHCNIIAKIRPVHILTVLFLLFIFYLGIAALPPYLTNTVAAFQDQRSLRSFIRHTNEQYENMLEANAQKPLLQNKGTYIDLNGLVAGILQQSEVNKRVKLTNGHLGIIKSEVPDPEEIRRAAEGIINFHHTHTASGGSFLFVLVPSQISKYEDLLPPGYQDTTNATADTFLSMLEQAGVSCLDLREELHNDGISITDAYYATDHHWKPQTGFWAFGKIVKKLEQISAIDPLDPFFTDPDNYIFETYEDTFLGSAGKRTGIYYSGLDDSILLRPNFETDIRIQIPCRDMDIRGRYEEICYNADVVYDFSNPNYYAENIYGQYGWGDQPITHWRNEQAPEKGKFLLIGESFGNIPFSLMSICFGTCDELDVRLFEEDFSSYYYDYQPDTVVMVLNIFAIISEITEYTYFK